MADIAQRVSWRPVYTASKWVTLLDGMRGTLRDRGDADAMTNREAVAFIREWANVSASPGNLFAQFAAVAYGWDPQRDTLNKSAAQGDRWYPLTPDVFSWASSIARELDDRADQPPRISPNKDTWTDPMWYGSIRFQLQQDGARANWKIPLPSCRDKKTGKNRSPLPPCDSKGRGPLLGYDRSGRPVFGQCDKPGDCEPVLLDDPVTFAGNQLVTLLLVLGAVWLLTQKQPHTRHG